MGWATLHKNNSGPPIHVFTPPFKKLLKIPVVLPLRGELKTNQ